MPDIGNRAGDALPLAEIVRANVQQNDIRRRLCRPHLNVYQDFIRSPSRVPLVIHVEIGIRRWAVTYSVQGTNKIDSIVFIEQQVPQVIPIAIMRT